MNPFQQYQQTKITTAAPEALILMLYDGAIRFSARARVAIENAKPAEAHEALIKCQDIVWELDNCLDHSTGEIADNLSRLYGYVVDRYVDANLRKDVVALDEATEIIRSMRQMWVDVMNTIAEERAAHTMSNAVV